MSDLVIAVVILCMTAIALSLIIPLMRVHLETRRVRLQIEKDNAWLDRHIRNQNHELDYQIQRKAIDD